MDIVELEFDLVGCWAFYLRSLSKKFDVDMYKDTEVVSVYSFTFNFKGQV